MRILMLNHNIAFGGATFDRVYNLGSQLARLGHQPAIMTISRKDRLRFQSQESAGVEVVQTPDLLWGIGRTGWDPWDTFRRVVHSQGRSYDAVYAFDSRPAVIVPALAYAYRHHVPLIMDWADWWGRGGTIGERSFKTVSKVMGPLEGWLEEAFRTKAARTTVISRALAERAASLGVAPETILRIPNGSNVQSIQPIGMLESRRRLNLAPDLPLIGHMGHLYPRDSELLKSALQHALVECPDIKVVMLGRPGSQYDISWAEHPATITPGYVPMEDMAAWLGACNALILPLTDSVHNRGRWPGKVNDYFAAGRPVISTAVGDMQDVLETYPVGLMSEPAGEALGRAILDMLGDPERQQAMGNAARELAETDLSWERIAAKVQRMLESLS
jgi:glycosyltransferase involved in cell wall biosynthesis